MSIAVKNNVCQLPYQNRSVESPQYWANICGFWCQQHISQAWISNCIPQYSMGYNCFSLPEISASGTKVLIFSVQPRGCVAWLQCTQYCADHSWNKWYSMSSVAVGLCGLRYMARWWLVLMAPRVACAIVCKSYMEGRQKLRRRASHICTHWRPDKYLAFLNTIRDSTMYVVTAVNKPGILLGVWVVNMNPFLLKELGSRSRYPRQG